MQIRGHIRQVVLIAVALLGSTCTTTASNRIDIQFILALSIDKSQVATLEAYWDELPGSPAAYSVSDERPKYQVVDNV